MVEGTEPRAGAKADAVGSWGELRPLLSISLGGDFPETNFREKVVMGTDISKEIFEETVVIIREHLGFEDPEEGDSPPLVKAI